MKERLRTLLAAVFFCLTLLPSTAFAAGGSLTVIKDEGNVSVDSTYDKSELTRVHAIDQDNAVYTVSGSAKKNRIVVNADNVTIKLETLL